MFQHANPAPDKGFERRFEKQVIRAMHRACFGKRVRNEWLAACADIMLKTFDPNRQIPGCSNGAARFSLYVPASGVPAKEVK